MNQLCMVRHCPYKAAGAIEDFIVCNMHDSHKVRRILEDGQQPAHYWMLGRPIVLPCGALEVEHFEARVGDGVAAEDAPEIIAAAENYEPTVQVHEKFDMFRE